MKRRNEEDEHSKIGDSSRPMQWYLMAVCPWSCVPNRGSILRPTTYALLCPAICPCSFIGILGHIGWPCCLALNTMTESSRPSVRQSSPLPPHPPPAAGSARLT